MNWNTYVSTATLLLVCQHYHSGQWSRGYRLQCALLRRLERAGFTNRCDLMQAVNDTLYMRYVAAFANKL